MARGLIPGGGFAAVVAAESLAKHLGPNHEIVVVSGNRLRGDNGTFPA
jgi:NADH dehydrogenase FAD-containing subunit